VFKGMRTYTFTICASEENKENAQPYTRKWDREFAYKNPESES